LFKNRPGSSKIVVRYESFASCTVAALVRNRAETANTADSENADHATNMTSSLPDCA
jgi:hypothetical protein